MPEIWGHVSVQGPHCHWGCANLSGLHCHLEPWWHPDLAVAEDHVWVRGSTIAVVCVTTKGYTELYMGRGHNL